MHSLWLALKIIGLAVAVFVTGFVAYAVKDWILHQKMARDRRKQAGTEGWCRFLDYLVHRGRATTRKRTMQPKITAWTTAIAAIFLAVAIYLTTRCF